MFQEVQAYQYVFSDVCYEKPVRISPMTKLPEEFYIAISSSGGTVSYMGDSCFPDQKVFKSGPELIENPFRDHGYRTPGVEEAVDFLAP